MAATATQRRFDASLLSSPEMKTAVFVSLAFHALVILVATVGLPYIKRPLPVISTPVPVELVPIDELTTTNKPPVQTRTQEPPPEIKESKPKEEKPPSPPKVDAKEPPKTVPPTPPKLKEEVAKPPAKVPPPPAEKLEKPPEPKPVEEKETAVEQEDQFLSVLRNLQDSEPETAEAEQVNPDAPPQPFSPLAAFSQRLTMSEADALRAQLSRCWSIQAGARYAEDLVVEVSLVMNPDRTVRQASILNQWRYNQDSFFRAAADSAIRAVRSPMCTPLELPPDKYEGWKEIVVNFDPREML